MTAPTQPPDPRVQRIADALTIWKYTVATDQADQKFARVLVEELGGREASVQGDGKPRTIWRQVMDALEVESNGDAVKKALTLRAQQRENAETIAALKERVEMAEAANTELDNARKSAEQSARDLRENNATLRAELDAINTKTEHDQALMDTQAKLIVDLETELDAIKGAQVPYRWAVVDKEGMSFTFTSLEKAQAWAIGDRGGVVPLYTHPAPALPVVGACVVNDKGEVTHRWSDRWLARDMDVLEVIARKENGTLYKLLLGDKIGAPLPTEGGK